MNNNSALAVSNISKIYPGGQTVFSNINFDIKSGERVAIIGANGSGKSTLLRSSLKLIPANYESIVLLGKEIGNLRGSKLNSIRASVGFVFQQHNLVPRLSVLSNVIHGALANSQSPRLWFQGLAPKAIREKALQHLDQVGLSHLAARRASDLSGGQSQRVAIARALMQDPELMVADEPVASLDPKAGEEVMELFSSLCKKNGITLIFVSHNLEHAIAYSDRIIGLRNQKVELDAISHNQKIESLREIYE